MHIEEKATAGRKLDRLVGEFLGVRVVRRTDRGPERITYDLLVPYGVPSVDWVDPDAPWHKLPRFSASDEDGWKALPLLFRKLAKERWEVELRTPGHAVGNRWECEMWRECIGSTAAQHVLGAGNSGPHAVCSAIAGALKL